VEDETSFRLMCSFFGDSLVIDRKQSDTRQSPGNASHPPVVCLNATRKGMTIDGIYYNRLVYSPVRHFNSSLHRLPDGIMSSGGIVGFNDDFPPAKIEAIRAVVIDRAQAEAQAQKAQ
jgi:hypothetical protein